MARQHKIGQFVPIYQRGLLAQAFEESQRGTNKTYSCMRYNELKINNANNKLHDPEWVKNASRRATPSLSNVHNYVSAFTTNKPDPTPCTVVYSLSVVAVFRHAQDIMEQIKLNKAILFDHT